MKIVGGVPLPNKKATYLQNFLLKGTVAENRDAYNKLSDLFDGISAYFLNEYREHGNTGYLRTYYRITYPGTMYLLIAAKENAKHNPYFAVVDISTREKTPVPEADVDLLTPLLYPGVQLAIFDNIEKSFSRGIFLSKSDEQMSAYIDEYDKLT